MSLKAFHVLFITLCTVLAAGFGSWAWTQHRLQVEGPYLFLALCGFGLAAALPIYGVWFLKKMKAVSFL